MPKISEFPVIQLQNDEERRGHTVNSFEAQTLRIFIYLNQIWNLAS